jgi:hypothetical protein
LERLKLSELGKTKAMEAMRKKVNPTRLSLSPHTPLSWILTSATVAVCLKNRNKR